jgi:Tol biopolymer transport system component
MRVYIQLISITIIAFNTLGTSLAFAQPPTANKLNTFSLAQSSDSAIVFASNRDGQFEIYRVDPDGRNLVRLTNNSADDTEPVWSFDGAKIAFTSTRDGNREIYVMNADGSGQINVTNNDADDQYSTWSPDSQKIAFSSTREGDNEIYAIKADGTNPINISNMPNSDEGFPAWSPDGHLIAFTSQRDQNREINIVQSDGTNLMNLGLNGTKPSWSPDGQQIVFEGDPEIRTSSDGTQYEATNIYRIDVNGNNLTKLGDNSAIDIFRSPSWSPNGKHIAFLGLIYGENKYGLYIMSSQGNGITLLYKEPDILAIHDGWIWSPDSKKIAFSMGSPVHSPYGEIYLLDLEGNEPFKIISDPEINIQPSWREITGNQLDPEPTKDPTERAPELTLQPTTQLPSQQSPSRTNYYFYIFGFIFTGLGALVTIILLMWLARRRGYPSKFLSLRSVGVISVLILVLAGLVIRTSSRNLGLSNPSPTTMLTLVPTSTATLASSPTGVSTDIINSTTPSPQPEQTTSQAEISCENNIFFVSLRSTPGTDAANKILEIPCGETVNLLGPSQKVDGLTWWSISWNGYTGWMADHTESGKVILRFNP